MQSRYRSRVSLSQEHRWCRTVLSQNHLSYLIPNIWDTLSYTFSPFWRISTSMLIICSRYLGFIHATFTSVLCSYPLSNCTTKLFCLIRFLYPFLRYFFQIKQGGNCMNREGLKMLKLLDDTLSAFEEEIKANESVINT